MGADMQRSPSSRMANGFEAAERKDYAAALSDFVWCFDVGAQVDPTFGGVRRSFLLGHMARLGRVYSPAISALQERRDHLRDLLGQSAATADQAIDFGALNRVLREESLTLDSYQNLKAVASEAVRAALFVEAMPSLLTAKDYIGISDGPIDLLAFVRDRLQQVSIQVEMMVTQVDADAVQYVKDSVVEEISSVYEALIGAHRTQQAAAVASALIAFDASGAVFASLVSGAVRAGAPDAGRELYRHGLTTVTDSEVGKLRAAVDSLLSGDTC